MGAIEDIFAKPPNEVTLIDIQKLIDEKLEESHNLEYKSPDILEKPPDLSKWVSALLNSDGGLIILGLCESDSKKKNKINPKIFPVKLEFVKNEYTKERIDQIIFSNIHCSSKPEIRIYPIRDPNDSSRAIYLIEIPQGDNPPYQANNKKYYRRLNSTKYEMPHSEIADFFGRRRRPKLSVSCLVCDPLSFDYADLKEAFDSGTAGVSKTKSSYRLQFIVNNIGHAAAKYARVIVSFENINITKVISGQDHRIDHLRGDLPTLQWDNPSGVVYAHSHGGDVVWDLQVRLHKGKWGTIHWEAQAEDMEFQKGNYVLLGSEASKLGNEIKPYYLRKHEDIFLPSVLKESHIESDNT